MSYSSLKYLTQPIANTLANERILILGLGREGLSTYRFLRQLLPTQMIGLADSGTHLPIELLNTHHIKTHLGKHYLKELDQYTLVFKTPGIPCSLPEITQSQKNGMKLSSNLQLFLDLVEAQKQHGSKQLLNLPLPLTIGVTGTKGKSTTASLIHHLLDCCGFQTALVGNIGKPALEEANQIASIGIFVIEMSSHQLSTLTTSPDIAVVQEVTSEHLDYFESTEAYVSSKEAITKYQKVNQYIIFNPNKQNTAKIASLSPGRKIKFTTEDTTETSNIDIEVNLKSHKLTLKNIKDDLPEQSILHRDQIPLLGKHNLQNIAPSLVIGSLLNLSSKQFAQAITSFAPLPHRLEKVALKNGITFVNDSLATMPDAAVSALSCFPKGSIVLLAGGHERHQDFSRLAKVIVEQQVKALALFPANGERLLKALETELNKHPNTKTNTKRPPHALVASMSQAMKFATAHATSGDVVLLSPGAASFGVFRDYADRGNQFREWVDSSYP